MNAVRKPAVAGRFYPGTTEELRATVSRLLETTAGQTDTSVPKALIAPHAGYIYSGSLAAEAYARIQPARQKISRVVILGPCHRVAVRGLASSSADQFETPLGSVPVDKVALSKIVSLPQVSIVDETHAEEHALEVHLPFLQTVLDDFKIVPLVVGDATNGQIAQVLDVLWGGEETLIVVSSDLSHYLDYETATSLDHQTCAAIEVFKPDLIQREQACGRIPIKGLLTVAQRRGMTVETLGLVNSGDTAGSKDRVVGYGAWAFHDSGDGQDNGDDFESQTRAVLDQFGNTFLKVAGATIEHGLKKNAPIKINLDSFPPQTQETGACFVTLTKNKTLRGCIGSPEAHQPLIQDVAHNAFRAAFGDPRFPNLEESEIENLEVSISVLSPQSQIDIDSEQDLLGQLRPSVDGLVISDKGKRALFLPSVWDQLPSPDEFLSRLKQKAGMKPDHWSDTFEARRFITVEAKQSGLDDPQSIWNVVSRQRRD